MPSTKEEVFETCQDVLPEWSKHSITDFEMDDPKGFSSFTMGVRSKPSVQPLNPPAVLFRKLEGKDNAILDFAAEKDVFLTLGKEGIAAQCYHYDDACRIEAFYQGRTLEAEDLFDPDTLKGIADQLFRFHQLRPASLPGEMFFDMLLAKWGRLARYVLVDRIDAFPSEEQRLCEELHEIFSDEASELVKSCIPNGELTFCHNDTYHGNIMKLDTGEIRLLDFEFSCLNNKAYDFSNLFAETVMQHKQPDYPYFRIAEPEYGDRELRILIDAYLDNATFRSVEEREREAEKLLSDVKMMLPLSHYKYAMAALPLALEPIQKIRFIPYSLQRFRKFQETCGR